MVGAFISYRRSPNAEMRARLQAKRPGRRNWWPPICTSLLLACVAVLVMQIASTAAGVIDNGQKQRERDEDCRSVPCPYIVPTNAQNSRLDILVPVAETQKSAADISVPLLDTQNSGPATDVPLPEEQKPGPDVRQPEAQKLPLQAKGSALPHLVLPADLAKKVGHKIWLNETGGNRDAITSWNANEEFASLGIGHFIWFPVGKKAPFEESFPPLLEFLRSENVRLPPWVDRTPIPPCPWTSRADFTKNFNSPEMKELRQFLLDTVAGQKQFLVVRARGAINKILESTPESAEREHVITQFSRIAQASKDLYPLIDYINFKGEGTNPVETAPDKKTGTRQGWGLKQVLLKMTGTTGEPLAVLAEFADAAQFVLQQRIRNMPNNGIWEAGWLHRIQTYRRPITNIELNPKTGG